LSFVDAARERTAASGPGGTCRFALLLETLDPPLAVEIVEAMSDRHITLVAIARELDARGLTVAGKAVTHHTLERHRRGACQCTP
jgi:hypothetical protein